MHLTVQSTWVDISGRTPFDLLDQIDNCLSYFEDGYWFDPHFKAGHTDGKVHLFYHSARAKRMGFPAGLLSRVTNMLDELGYEYTVDDQREMLPRKEVEGLTLYDSKKGTINLYGDQLEVLNVALTELRGILNCATNFGKTEVAAGLFQQMPGHGLMIVNRAKLLRQTADRLRERLKIPIGVVGDGAVAIYGARITVATIQTLHSRLHDPTIANLLKNTKTLVVDEAQFITPNTYFKVLSACPASMRIGLSATAKYKTKLPAIEAYLGPILAEVEELELVDAGRSAKPVVMFLDIKDNPMPSGIEWPLCYEAGIVRSNKRTQRTVDVARQYVRLGLPTLILVNRIHHGDTLHGAVKAAGLSSAWVHGSMSSEVVDWGIKSFQARESQVLIASPILGVGVDIPEIGAFINAGGWESKDVLYQNLGRALRRKKDANLVLATDFWDSSHEILTRHSRSRWTAYQKKGFKPTLMEDTDVTSATGSGG